MTSEKVADYPRPPRLEVSADHVLVRIGGEILFDGTGCQRVLETFHPPTYYLPPAVTNQELLIPAAGRSFCEWKGIAEYFDVMAGGRRVTELSGVTPHRRNPSNPLQAGSLFILD